MGAQSFICVHFCSNPPLSIYTGEWLVSNSQPEWNIENIHMVPGSSAVLLCYAQGHFKLTNHQIKSHKHGKDVALSRLWMGWTLVLSMNASSFSFGWGHECWQPMFVLCGQEWPWAWHRPEINPHIQMQKQQGLAVPAVGAEASPHPVLTSLPASRYNGRDRLGGQLCTCYFPALWLWHWTMMSL